MGQAQSKTLSTRSKTKPERSEKVEVPVEDWERDSGSWIIVYQPSEQRSDEGRVSLEDRMDEFEGGSTELEDQTQIKEQLAALNETINSILQEKIEEKARLDHKVAALEKRTLELEEAAQAIFAEKAECEQRLAAMSETIDERVQERTEKQKAECDQKLAAVMETFDDRVLERTEIHKAEWELKLAALTERIDELVQSKAEERADCEQTRAAMSETIEERVLERTEILKAECQLKLAAMCERIDELVQEKTDEKARLDHKVAALEKRTLELEEAAQAISAERADCEQTRAAMSETIEERVLERTEILKAECQLKLAAMCERIDELVQEKTDEKASLDHKVAALEKRTLELEEAAQAISAEKAVCEQKLATMSATIDERVLEKAEIHKAEWELKLAALTERIDELVQNKAEENARMDHHVVALEMLTIRLEEATQEISEERADCEQTRAAMSETIEEQVLERTETLKAECQLKLAAMCERIDELVQEKTDEKASLDHKVVALEKRTLELEEAAQAISAEKAACEQKLATMSATIDELVLEKVEEKAEYEETLAAMSETIDSQVLERMEIQKAHYELKLAAVSETIAKQLQIEKTEMLRKATIEPNADITAKPVDLLILASVEQEAQMDHRMAALGERCQVLQEEFWSKVVERTHMEIKEHAVEKRTAILEQAAQAISEESMEFQEKSAPTSDTIDLRVLTTTQEKMTATSTDPITTTPTAPESRNPSSVQSNSSEQLKSQNPHLHRAMSEEGALEEPCSSCISLVESIRSQWRDIYNRGLDIGNKGLDGEQKKQTAALDSGSISLFQEEVSLPPPKRIPNTETPAVEEKMVATHSQNELETSDELSLGPEQPADLLEESLRLLNSDGLMKIEGLLSIHRLAMDQPEIFFPEMEEICLVILREVMNPWYMVSGAALRTLADLLSVLKWNFDPFLDLVAEVLFQKAASNSKTLQQFTNRALDHMIQSCSPLPCMKALLSVLSHQSMPDPDQEAVARECFAVHLLALVESVRYEPEMHEVVLSVRHLTQDTSEVVRSCAEKTLAILSKHLEIQESMEFQEKSAPTSDTIDLRLLTTTQEKMTATSTDPITTTPTAPESRNPSSIQSNSSEQLKSQSPHLHRAMSEEGALEEPCSSCISAVESIRSQWRDIHNRGLDIGNKGLDGEQKKQTAALDSGSISLFQEEVSLPPPKRIPNTETPAVEEKMVATHCQNVLETSDELSLGPERPADLLEESLRLLNSDGLMKIEGLLSIHRLAMHQPEILLPEMEEICRVILREVMNPWYLVSGAALRTLADLLSVLKWNFDPFLDLVAEVLFQKAASDSKTLQQFTNRALDHMIQTCSPLPCMKALLSVLSHQSMPDPDQEAVAQECFAVHLLALVEYGRYEPEMHEVVLSVRHLTQDTSEVVRSCAEKTLAILSKHLEESMEFQEKSAPTSDTIDLRLLTTTQEKMTATSTDPITTTPTAPGSRNPSSIQSNSSEQQKSQSPHLHGAHLHGAMSEEGALEEPCSSCISLVESIRSQWRDIHNRGLDIGNKGLDEEQKKQTAALDSSSISLFQEEVNLPPPERSPNTETPAVEGKMVATHCQNVLETSDELSLGPERPAEVEESFRFLNSDYWFMKIEGLNSIHRLAMHQPEILFPEMEEICRVILREVMNPWYSVSSASLRLLADLLSFLKRSFDPFLDGIAVVLFQKVASNDKVLQRLTNVTLNHMIRSCSPLPCMKALLSVLSHQSMPDPDQEAVARECCAMHLLALVEYGRYEPEMHEVVLSVRHLTQDTSEEVRSCAEKTLAILSKHLEESMEFQEKSAPTSNTIDLRLLTTTQEKMTATSTDPITTTPTAPESRNPSSVQSNSSEQLKSQNPNLHRAMSEEGALEEPCSSCISAVESIRSQWRDIHNRGLDIGNKGLDGEQKKQTAALDSSSISLFQEEVTLPPPKRSPNTETPAMEEKMVATHCQNVLETSDELSLGPERPAEVEESFRFLNSDYWFMKIEGLNSIHRLAMHQPVILLPEMEEICRVILREVMNPWDSVSSASLRLLADLFSFLKRNFDPFLDGIAVVLFQKVASNDKVLQRLTNVTLDHMIRSCSPLPCMKALLSVLSHQSMPDPDQEAVAQEFFAVHLLALVEYGRYEPEMHEVVLSVRHLTQDTSEVDRSCAEKTLAILSKHLEESMEFQEKSAPTSDTIDVRLLTTTQEKMTATSADPITTTPTAPGSRNPSSIQSNSSEQLKSQNPHLHKAMSEEGALEEPCSSCISSVESIRSQRRDIHNRGLDIGNKGLDGEQKKQTAALDSSSISLFQEEVNLPPPKWSPNTETPAVEEKMVATHCQNVLETSDELSLGPERPADLLEESLRLLNSDGLMKTEGLLSILQLAMHLPELLFPEMEEICLVILREVMNPWDLVSGAALRTLADLLFVLKWYFDPFLDLVAEVLFQKAASDCKTLQQFTNRALDHMIQTCSPLPCMKALLSVLSHQSMPDPDQEAVARECFAVHLLALVESARYEPEMHEVVLSVRHLTQDTSEVVRSCAEKTLAILSKHLEESMEFQEKSAPTSDTIDLRLLTTTQEKMTATSTDPITTTPTAPGSRNPSSIQSNSSEQLKSQNPHLHRAMSEEGALEEPCSSCISSVESIRSQWRDIHNRGLDISNKGLDGEQKKQTAALDSSSISLFQEEVSLPPPKRSPNTESPAVEEKMVATHCQNVLETSDELSLGPERPAEVEESFRFLNSDYWFMKIEGLNSIHRLAMHQPVILLPEMEEICRVILREVMNPWDSVSSASLRLLADLLSFLTRNFDPFLDGIAVVLFQKVASNNKVLQRLTNVTLDHMIRSCSPLPCMKALLSVLSYQSMPDPDQEAVARECFAIHLLALVEYGRYELEMHEVILSVRHLTQDTSEVDRSCAEKTLVILSKHLEVNQ